jgi:hypothetical protein
MKWNGNKARQKQATGRQRAGGRNQAGTLPSNSRRGGAAGNQPGRNAGAGQRQRPGDVSSKRGNASSLGSYGSNRDANKAGRQGKQSLQNQKSRQGGGQVSNQRSRQGGGQFSNQNRSRSNAGAFGGYGGGGSNARRQSSRGNSSFRSSGRPPPSRGGGGGGRRR